MARNPDREWIGGTGWDYEIIGGVLLIREDLDAVVPAGIKVVLWRVCLHILVASTKALVGHARADFAAPGFLSNHLRVNQDGYERVG